MLIPYWADKLQKIPMLAYQGGERGGELRCRLEGDRVLIGGQATTYLTGKVFLRQDEHAVGLPRLKKAFAILKSAGCP